MKKIIIFATFIIFLTTSQIQLIHAASMWKMINHDEMIQLQKKDESVFCETSTNWSDCYDDSIQEKYILVKSKNTNNLIVTNIIYPSLKDNNFKIYKIKNSHNTNSPPYIYISTYSSYLNLIWIVKNLN
ncbi:MAG: hypothetical protein ACD_4C00313G0005 [uncultured bacterium (gcode 4)]|uniref:Uncharacterized protein n=1 Tax=uncultured bacterium (gcode 4) TaxID=1234023 RepID=K2FTU9_9BACT|nr:MAG: hypothetical protein ACD_4C00313G0005 [uncultured bacterium (gcode 4)]